MSLSDFDLLFGLVSLDKAVDTIKNYKNMFNLPEGDKLIYFSIFIKE